MKSACFLVVSLYLALSPRGGLAARSNTPAVDRMSPCAWPPGESERYWNANSTYGLPAFGEVSAGPMVAVTSGALAARVGMATIEAGGSAADAAVSTALAQVTLAAGSWTSFAGMLYALYYEADSGRVYALNAGFDTVRGETDPLTIPSPPAPSGRTAMVGGFMAGAWELNRRFGKLQFDSLVGPAICLAEDGIRVDSFLAAIIAAKRDVLTRTPEGLAIFTKPDGTLYEEGDTLRQPQLARTLRKVAEEGPSYMYVGEWAAKFVKAVRDEGGKIAPEDLESYAPEWQDPLTVHYHDCVIYTLPPPELGGVQLAEALNMVELAPIGPPVHYTESAEALFWFIEISRAAYVITYSPSYKPDPRDECPVHWISPASRAKKETAARLWKLLQEPGWEEKLNRELDQASASGGRGGEPAGQEEAQDEREERERTEKPPHHSDAIIVSDAEGNIAVVVHSINTSLWGATGIFVDGVSIPDPASFQQRMVAKAGPGRRFPNVVNPVLATAGGKPRLAAAAIGNALHECMLQHTLNILDYGIDPRASLETPKFWGPLWGGDAQQYLIQALDAGSFRPEILDAVRRMGRPLRELGEEERKKRVSYWAGIAFDPGSGRLAGAVSREFNGAVETERRPRGKTTEE